MDNNKEQLLELLILREQLDKLLNKELKQVSAGKPFDREVFKEQLLKTCDVVEDVCFITESDIASAMCARVDFYTSIADFLEWHGQRFHAYLKEKGYTPMHELGVLFKYTKDDKVLICRRLENITVVNSDCLIVIKQYLKSQSLDINEEEVTW